MWDYLLKSFFFFLFTKAFFFFYFWQNLLVWQLAELAELAALAKPCDRDRNGLRQGDAWMTSRECHPEWGDLSVEVSVGSHVKQAGALGTSVGQSTYSVCGSVLAKAVHLSSYSL
jgi:hypothetical protein